MLRTLIFNLKYSYIALINSKDIVINAAFTLDWQ
jgi:hypothetical protein